MLVNYAFGGSTSVVSTARSVGLSFAPDTNRTPTFFVGKLHRKLAFREAISALHDVVVSDLRGRTTDRTAYKLWAAQQEARWLADYVAGYDQHAATARLTALRQELDAVQRTMNHHLKPFHAARQRYFDYLYQTERDAWLVLDPVITVHPDELFFECFSQDESAYGHLSASHNAFTHISELACGTTNVDYSTGLYNEFQKIRDYKETDFRIDPSGFDVQTGDGDRYKEVNIDLPDSWVRGFLQVSSAMTLPATPVELHPLDVYDLCSTLRRFREKAGPRSLRFRLTPGQPVRLVFDPWGRELVCARSRYTGTEAQEIRLWGRRRLLTLERLIPVARRFTVHLLGSGLPSFWVADLGDLRFTLGLSGWTANDWSRRGQFDLMAPRAAVAPDVARRVFAALQETWAEAPAALARRLHLDPATVHGALGLYVQAGRAIFDLQRGVYRVRELTREPLSAAQFRFDNPQEAAARRWIDRQAVTVRAEQTAVGVRLHGAVRLPDTVLHPTLLLDPDERLAEAHCGCGFFKHNKLHQGPCEHLLAVRMLYHQSVK